MKKLKYITLTFILMSCLTTVSMGQSEGLDIQCIAVKDSIQEKKEVNKGETLCYVDEIAQFKEGDFATFMVENYIFTEDMMNHGSPGSLYAYFIVEADGSILHVLIPKGKGLSTMQDNEIIRIIRLTSGKWEPAKVDGKPIRSMFKQQVNFNPLDFSNKVQRQYNKQNK